MNPELILEEDIPKLIDEWQEVPSVWDAVRGREEEILTKGQFILNGLASINKSKYIHSGTGRFMKLRMRTMSLYEIGKSDGKISLSN